MPELGVNAKDRYDNRGRKLVILLLALGAFLLIVAVVAATRTMFSITNDTDAVEHTLEAQKAISQLTARAERIETARRGFLIQPDESFRTIIGKASSDFDTIQANLGEIIADNPVQQQPLARVRMLDRERDEAIAAMFASPSAAVARLRSSNFNNDRGVTAMREMRSVLGDMFETENGLLNQRNRNQLDSLVAFYITGGLAFALLIVMMVAAITLVMRYNRDLTLAQIKLRAVNEGLEDAVAARTTELSRANEEIQRFAYIVSHDLRSPLVNVLGFTSELDQARKTLHGYFAKLFENQPELRDEAAWLAVDEDLPEALGFIRTSTEKMDRLINSILELSRQGRRTLNPERLDMTEMAEIVASTMRQLADAAGAKVIVSAVPDLESDRIAVEQILSNLVENALKYLSPARAGEVHVDGRKVGKRVEISVTDNGRGIAPADHQRIFDLFRRAGAQDQPGEGIGLANVRALAYRLGGRITVESQLDEGSRFTLDLPTKLATSEPA